METNAKGNQRSIQDYLSIGYLFLILCGLAKDAIYYGFMGINIMDYASISDVLLSPVSYLVKNYYVILGLFLFVMMLNFMSKKMGVWHKKYKHKTWYNLGMDMDKYDYLYEGPQTFEKALPLISIGILSFFLGTGLGGGMEEKKHLENKSHKASHLITFTNEKTLPVNIVGQNSQFVFYVTDSSSTVAVTPFHGNIKKIIEIEKEEEQ